MNYVASPVSLCESVIEQILLFGIGVGVTYSYNWNSRKFSKQKATVTLASLFNKHKLIILVIKE